jgi:hypothetical protein
MTTPATSPEVLAKISARRCPLCPHPIRAGEDYISRLPQIGWVHAACAARYRQVLAEHDEGGEDR